MTNDDWTRQYFHWRQECERLGFNPDMMEELIHSLRTDPEMIKLVRQLKNEKLEDHMSDKAVIDWLGKE